MIPLLAAAVAAALFAHGCAPLADAQQNLVTQARRGVDQCEAGFEERTQLVGAYHELQARRLGEAFEADVRSRAAALDAEWVLDHGRAHAAALEALTDVRVAQAARDGHDRANFAAVRGALDGLERLARVQSKAADALEEVTR